MCTKLKVADMYIRPGMVVQYRTLSAIKSGRFGIASGSIPNVRQDKLTTTWAKLFANRGVLEATSFMERGYSFGKSNKPCKIAIIFDSNGDMAIVTIDATPEIARVHGRMPAIIENEADWLQRGFLNLADSDVTFKPL